MVAQKENAANIVAAILESSGWGAIAPRLL